MDVVGTCVSMALQYGVPLITLVDKFRHARFEPAGMTSNKNIPFAKSLIDYIFCWMGCQFIPGYAEKNTPNRSTPAVENKTSTTARQLVEKTQDLAKKIDEAKAIGKKAEEAAAGKKEDLAVRPTTDKKTASPEKSAHDRFAQQASDRVVQLVSSALTAPEGTEAAVMHQFNGQFEHFQDDAPACDVCGSITVRNGTCYRCFNCGNSMGCS